MSTIPVFETVLVSLLAGDVPKLLMAAPLSKATTFTLCVDGPFGEHEAKNLLRYLALQIEVMLEPDALARPAGEQE